MSIPVCKFEDLEDPGSMGFDLPDTGDQRGIFIIKKDGRVYGYVNSCPHTGANLEWQEHQFLDMDKAFIQCSTHDAIFEIDTGLCIQGPCAGDCLTAIGVSVDYESDPNGIVMVDLGSPDQNR